MRATLRLSRSHTRPLLAFAAAGALLCVSSVTQRAPTAAAHADPFRSFRELPSPAGPGSGQPHLAVAPDGTVLMSWLEPDASASGRQVRFRLAEWRGGQWSEARTVAEGPSFFVNWADVPSIVALRDGTVAAHWLERSGPATYAYDVRVRLSSDRGRTWSDPITPHRDRTQTEHGFASLFEAPDGGLGLVWLDGRATAGGTGAPSHEPAGAMTLRATSIRGGALGAEMLVDARVCDCCPTAAVRTPDGVLVAYRDRSETEVRDIAVVRYERGAWTKPSIPHPDRWQIPGCPVNGPALASDGSQAALAWFAAPNNTAHVSVAFSTNGGASFGPAVRVDDGVPLGRVAAALLPNHDVLVGWIEFNEGNSELRVRQVGAGGTRSASWRVASVTSERASGFPRLARSGETIVLAWTATAPARQVRVAVATLP